MASMEVRWYSSDEEAPPRSLTSPQAAPRLPWPTLSEAHFPKIAGADLENSHEQQSRFMRECGRVSASTIARIRMASGETGFYLTAGNKRGPKWNAASFSVAR